MLDGLKQGGSVGDRHSASRRAKEIAATLGLGLLWAAEEMLTLCVGSAPGVSGADGATMLYVICLPAYCIFGLLVSLAPGMRAWLSRRDARYAVALSGVLGVFLLVAFPTAVGVAAGVILFCFGAVMLNCLWFVEMSEVSALRARRIVVSAAAVTTVMTLFWDIPSVYVFVVVVALFLASVGAFACAQDVWNAGDRVRVARAHAWRTRFDVVCGAFIVLAAFGFLQYIAYYVMPPSGIFREVVSHACSLALLAVVLFATRDTEHTIAVKLAVALMLFAFVLLLTSQEYLYVSIAVAAGADNLFELVMMLALAELARYARLDARRVYGWYAALTSGAQFAGCATAMIDLAFSPVESYAVVGMLFVILLIVTAIWLLDEHRAIAFLWGGDGAGQEDSPVASHRKGAVRAEGPSGEIAHDPALPGEDPDGDRRGDDVEENDRANAPSAGSGRGGLPQEGGTTNDCDARAGEAATGGDARSDVSAEDVFDQNVSEIAEDYGLTPRETDVMLLFGKGRSSTFIAEQFCVSTNTVRSHISHIYSKCGIHSRQELITLVENWSRQTVDASSAEGTDAEKGR